MDGTRFDKMAKSLASGRSRRSLLKGLIAGAVAATTTKVLSAQACTPPGFPNYCNADIECCDHGLCINGICQCPSGTKKCGDRCISQSSTCGPQYCPTGYTTCGTQCVDKTRDTNNCGSCGHVCSVGQICSNSHCCPKGYVFCDSQCKISSQCTLTT